ncbi:MAG TPA: hypothetical protein VKT30_17485 [Caulobacteraceae bacterium]|nr:hypothetical protein [Caulobacteraceae bacterium]
MSETDFRDPSGPKPPAIPRFKTEAVHLPFRSKEAGRPIYEDREFVEILIPGDRRSMAVEAVSDGHKARWPKEYAAFRAGQEPPLEGTPLADWPNSSLTRARVEELAYFNIRTVEHLAQVNDAQLANLGMGARPLREAARKFLDVARQGTGPLERLVAENLALKDENARLERALAEANARPAPPAFTETPHAHA